jgi:hypothetical protein
MKCWVSGLPCSGAGVLARGDAAINLRFPHKGYREKIWDHAAGALIVQEAGARISDASGGASGHEVYRNPLGPPACCGSWEGCEDIWRAHQRRLVQGQPLHPNSSLRANLLKGRGEGGKVRAVAGAGMRISEASGGASQTIWQQNAEEGTSTGVAPAWFQPYDCAHKYCGPFFQCMLPWRT